MPANYSFTSAWAIAVATQKVKTALAFYWLYLFL
jgi:hypothetical protein